jgi:hypothetical protein
METSHQPGFSRARRWNVAFNVALSIVAVLSVAVMVNYLSGRYFQRVYLGTQTGVELHAPTITLLRSVTNQVQVTLYYSKDAPFFGDVVGLLREYVSRNPKIEIRMVDCERDPGRAQEVKTKYDLGSATNVIIFDCAGRKQVLPGDMLADYDLLTVPGGFYRKPLNFKGEMMFTSALLAVTSLKPFKAYFLQGHGEHLMDDGGGDGYLTFASVFRQNYIDVEPLSLLGTNTVPADCDVLIVAGPIRAIPDVELGRIEEYLNRGGRLFALFDVRTWNRETGLEKILARWGVGVGAERVVDEDKLVRGQDMVISAFSRHPLVNPLLGSGLYLTIPRPVFPKTHSSPVADAPKVEVVAATGTNSYLAGDPLRRASLPVITVVDKPSVRGVFAEGGTTRMIIAGDSFFLSNGQIENLSNRDFVNLAANWLVDRTALLAGLGPRPVDAYRVLVTQREMRRLQWIMLGAMPGGVVLFGGLVWFRRRK